MILLDTNALIWLEQGHARSRVLHRSDRQLYVSPASLLELQFLIEAGRIRLREGTLEHLAEDDRWLLDDPPRRGVVHRASTVLDARPVRPPARRPRALSRMAAGDRRRDYPQASQGQRTARAVAASVRLPALRLPPAWRYSSPQLFELTGLHVVDVALRQDVVPASPTADRCACCRARRPSICRALRIGLRSR